MSVQSIDARIDSAEAFVYNFAVTIPAVLLVIPLAWYTYTVHLIVSLAVVGFYKPLRTGAFLLFALSCLFLAAGAYQAVTLRQAPQSSLLLFGFAGTCSCWLALLLDPQGRARLPDPEEGTLPQ